MGKREREGEGERGEGKGEGGESEGILNTKKEWSTFVHESKLRA